MSMATSAEVRWFYPGPLPESVEVWFADEADTPTERRIDWYLLMPGVETAGIKVRGTDGGSARLEVKARSGDVTDRSFSPGVTGSCSRWVKWSEESPSATWLRSAMTSDASWIAVMKTRRQGFFRAWDDSIESVPRSASNVCSVEVAAVSAGEARWWTLGFEAVAGLGDVDALLDASVTAWLESAGTPPGNPLTVEHSMSYPAWLTAL